MCRYKTRLCSFGSSCNRSICFFAHTTEELRCVPNVDDGKEVDEREFLMQLMMAQESGLLPGGSGMPLQHQEQQPPPPSQQQQQQQLPVLYTMPQDALQQPMQMLAQPMRSSSSGLSSSAAARRHAPARSLTGIPLSYRQSLPCHLHSGHTGTHLGAGGSPYSELPSRAHAQSMNGSISSAPPSSLQLPPAAESAYLSLQETLAGLGLQGPASMGCGIRGADHIYADQTAAMLHNLQSMPSGEQPRAFCARSAAAMQRASDPGMHALLGGASAGAGGNVSSDDEGGIGGLAGADRVSDSGKPLGSLCQGSLMPSKEFAESLNTLLPFMNYAQQQHQQQQQAVAAAAAAAVDIAAGGLHATGRGPSSSLASSGSARSSSPPTSYDTNSSSAPATALLVPSGSPTTLGSPPLAAMQAAQKPSVVSLHSPQQQQQQQQLKKEDLRVLAASAGQASGISPSYVTKILTDLHDQGLAGAQLADIACSLASARLHL